ASGLNPRAGASGYGFGAGTSSSFWYGRSGSSRLLSSRPRFVTSYVTTTSTPRRTPSWTGGGGGGTASSLIAGGGGGGAGRVVASAFSVIRVSKMMRSFSVTDSQLTNTVS